MFLLHKNSPKPAARGQLASSSRWSHEGSKAQKQEPISHFNTSETMTSKLSKSGLKDHINQAGGAPQKRIKRSTGIRVRLTTTERFLIESKARQAGMRISDWFRAAALKAKVVGRITAEDRHVLHLLAGMANNLNQLTKRAHTNGIMSIVISCGHLLTEIDQTLKYLNSDDGKDT